MLHIVSGYACHEKLHESDRSTVYRGHRESDGVPVVIKLQEEQAPSPAELVVAGMRGVVAHHRARTGRPPSSGRRPDWNRRA